MKIFSKSSHNNSMEISPWFLVGDYLSGMVTGLLVAWMIRLLILPGVDMVLAMIVGMVVGMFIHLALGFLLAPLLGMFQTMVPGSIIGMYGGMLFAMRDSMGAGSKSLSEALFVGALFGIVVVASFHIYDRILHGKKSTDCYLET
ncbi:hypothetical protein A7Q09_10240 [Methylacidiphilum sp. Yel]|jgi:hypothetical protein|nr:hypothetical protein A7Q09_10240 [Methylacidiphilum sp. Yel]